MKTWWAIIGGILLAAFVVALITILTFRPSDENKKINTIKPTKRAQNIEDIKGEKTPATKGSELTIETIFNPNKVGPTNKDNLITIVATGDYIPARSVNTQTLRAKDFTWAVGETAKILRGGDVTLVNMETSIFGGCAPTDEGFIFCGESGHVEALTFADVNVVNLANNHTHNYGEEGIEETIKLLAEGDIEHSGAGEIAYLTVKGSKIAFLGYNDVGYTPKPLAAAEDDLVKQQIMEASKNADIVVVSFHWGEEYTAEPTERQVELARFTIDSGADLVIGNHPHWIQPLEIYKNKPIMYAHGNYVFDQMWSEETREGVIGIYTFDGDTIVDIDFVPTYITNYGKSNIADENRAKKILTNLREVSLVHQEDN